MYYPHMELELNCSHDHEWMLDRPDPSNYPA
jgi:hypothetical protein